MKTKKYLILVVLLLVSFILLSCESGITAGNTPPADGNSLGFRITWKDYSGRGVAIRKIVDKFNQEQNSTVTVSMIGGDEEIDTIEGMLQSGDTDMVYVLPYRYVQYFGDKGYLKDLSDVFSAEKDLFYPKLWELGTVKDKVYGIPWLGHSMCLLYNKTLLEKAGVDPASIKDMDSLVAAMEAVEFKTDAKGIGLVGADHNNVSWMVNQFIYGFGSTLVDDTGTKVTVNNEKSKEALLFYKNVLGAHAQDTWTNDTGVEVMDCFRKQEVAFEFQGIWGVTDIQQNGSPFEVGIISLNQIGLCAEVGPMMLAIPAQMDNEAMQGAESFIRFLISKDAQAQIMDGEYSPEHDTYYPFRTPIRKDMAESDIFTEHPEYKAFLIGFENPSVDVPVPKWQTIKDEYYAPGLHQFMAGQITADDFLATIEEKGNEILNGELEN